MHVIVHAIAHVIVHAIVHLIRACGLSVNHNIVLQTYSNSSENTTGREKQGYSQHSLSSLFSGRRVLRFEILENYAVAPVQFSTTVENVPGTDHSTVRSPRVQSVPGRRRRMMILERSRWILRTVLVLVRTSYSTRYEYQSRCTPRAEEGKNKSRNRGGCSFLNV